MEILQVPFAVISNKRTLILDMSGGRWDYNKPVGATPTGALGVALAEMEVQRPINGQHSTEDAWKHEDDTFNSLFVCWETPVWPEKIFFPEFKIHSRRHTWTHVDVFKKGTPIPIKPCPTCGRPGWGLIFSVDCLWGCETQ